MIGGAAAAWPLAARSEQGQRVRRIGFLGGGARPVSLESSFYGGLLQGLRELGYVEGRDFVIEWRFAEGRYELIPALAAELVGSNVDIIVLATSHAVQPTQHPVGNGFIGSLARPGGNTTGLTPSAQDTAPKQLELLRAVFPNLSRVGVLVNPDETYTTSLIKNLYAAAHTAGNMLTRMDVRKAAFSGSEFPPCMKRCFDLNQKAAPVH